MIPGLTKTFTAEAAVTRRRICKFGATDSSVLMGAAATDLLMGVSDMSADVPIGHRCEVRLSGIAEVEFGGAVTRGQPITSDAIGRAVAAAPGAGVNNRLIGFAMVSAVLGDIGDVFMDLGSIQG
ncbi:hypothetical protein BH10PSE5_BH10PSE5_01300 [soil metagenome]